MLKEAIDWYGVRETPGTKNEPAIMGWAKELRLSDYTADSIPWCGLFMAYIAKVSNKPIPKNPLWALNWRNFGTPVERPMLGDVMIKNRTGGGHVTLYVGEDSGYYHCLGGNQGDAVDISRFPKTLPDGQRWFFRRPKYFNQPDNVRTVKLAAKGGIIKSEA